MSLKELVCAGIVSLALNGCIFPHTYATGPELLHNRPGLKQLTLNNSEQQTSCVSMLKRTFNHKLFHPGTFDSLESFGFYFYDKSFSRMDGYYRSTPVFWSLEHHIDRFNTYCSELDKKRDTEVIVHEFAHYYWQYKLTDTARESFIANVKGFIDSESNKLTDNQLEKFSEFMVLRDIYSLIYSIDGDNFYGDEAFAFLAQGVALDYFSSMESDTPYSLEQSIPRELFGFYRGLFNDAIFKEP